MGGVFLIFGIVSGVALFLTVLYRMVVNKGRASGELQEEVQNEKLDGKLDVVLRKLGQLEAEVAVLHESISGVEVGAGAAWRAGVSRHGVVVGDQRGQCGVRSSGGGEVCGVNSISAVRGFSPGGASEVVPSEGAPSGEGVALRQFVKRFRGGRVVFLCRKCRRVHTNFRVCCTEVNGPSCSTRSMKLIILNTDEQCSIFHLS